MVTAALRPAARMLLLVLVALAVAGPAWAATARLQLDTTDLTVGQTGRLVLYLVDGRTRNAPDLQMPEGLDARFYGSSQRLQVDNFSRTRLYAYEYRITSHRAGTYTIGPVEVELADGSTLRTNEVTLEVKDRADDPAASEIQATAGFDTELAWEGQVVVYGYRLVARVPILGVDWRLPDFEGLRAPQHGNPHERSYFIGEQDGGRTSVVEGSIPFLATGTGERAQVPAVAQVRVPSGRTDLLGFRQYRPETIATEPAGLVVRPLPPAPPGFSGLVGEFVFDAELEDADAAVGESVPLTIEVAGDGSLEGWGPPDLTIDGASVYVSDASIGARLQDGRYVANGVFRRTVVPTREGELRVPPIEIVTFSPSKQAYVTHRVELDPLPVAAGREASGALESFSADLPEGEGGEVVAIGFRDIYTWGASRAYRIHTVLPFLAVAAATPGFLVVFGLLADRAHAWREARREARRPPPSPLDHLRQLPDAPVARLGALDAALRLALAQHAGVEVQALDRVAAVSQLQEPLRGRVEALGQALDRARFAGKSPPPDVEREVREVVVALGAR